MKLSFTHVVIGVVVLVVAGIAASRFIDFDSGSGQYDGFAQCLKDKGAIFYGAFWCPHCAEQKRMFGKSVEFLPYTECSAPDGRTQLQVCKDAGVESYPTWVFTDGTRLEGEQQLSALAEKTGCALP